MCVVLLCSCNIQEGMSNGLKDQMEQMSNNIKDQIIDMAGQFIEKNTDTENEQSQPSDMPSEKPSDSSSENVPDVPDKPTEPDVPDVPDYVLLEREKYPLNKYVGINIIKQKKEMHDDEYKFNTVYGYGRFITTLEDIAVITPSSTPLTYFSISGIESVISLDFDLLKARLEPNEDEISFSEISKSIQNFASEYCTSANFLSNLRRIEVGDFPDEQASAKDYALLLNTIYDDNCRQNGESVGTTYINPEIRLITGKMSTINLPYLYALMDEIESGRDDEFLPIGGWSFSIQTEGKSPESAFLKNNSLKELIAYRNDNYNGIEILLSDFGWDTVNTESECYIAPLTDYTSEEIQSMYMLRAYLILNGMDVDKASYSTLNDTATNGEGIISKDGTKKLSFSIIEMLKSKMNGMFFKEAILNGENNIYCYKYENSKGKIAYAIWSEGSASYDLTGITGNVTVSTYDKNEGGYISTSQEVNNTLTLNTNGFVTFVEIDN